MTSGMDFATARELGLLDESTETLFYVAVD
jgi:hypothetical protein